MASSSDETEARRGARGDHPDSPGVASGSPSPKPSRMRRVRDCSARQRPQPAAPDGDRPGGAQGSRSLERVPGRRDCASVGARFRRARVPVPAREGSPERRSTSSPAQLAACPTPHSTFVARSASPHARASAARRGSTRSAASRRHGVAPPLGAAGAGRVIRASVPGRRTSSPRRSSSAGVEGIIPQRLC